MRVVVVEPQKTIECGICRAKDTWIQRINVRGTHGLYCLKCDTLTVFEAIHSKYIYQAFKDEVENAKSTTILK